MLRPTPINCAEAIFEPFWDPLLSGFAEWQVSPRADQALRIWQNWCFVEFEWTRRPDTGAALHMSRTFDVDCRGYDHLMISVMAPAQSMLTMSAVTDRGAVSFTSPPAPVLKKEHLLDLQGATVLHSITLEFAAGVEGVGHGWINWLGLQNAALLPRYLAERDRFDAAWTPYLQPAHVQPSFTPTYGLLVDAHDLAVLREQDALRLAEGKASPFAALAEQVRLGVPEKLVTDFCNIGTDTRYNREREHGQVLVGQAAKALAAGAILQDADLLRLGARYALALAMCDHWDWGMVSRMPGSAFEVRTFIETICCEDLALALDLAGDLFTPAGRDLLLRRIAEEGIGHINYNAWKHEYIHHCNQLAAFTPGRVLGYAVMERVWPRVRPYQELAYQDLIASLNDIILDDGGYVEGPGYFQYAIAEAGRSFYYYARSRGIDYASCLPEKLKRTAAFAAVLASTDDAQEFIPICDAGVAGRLPALAVMAAAVPDSAWGALFSKAVARGIELDRPLFTLQVAAGITPSTYSPEPWTYLPEMGIAASTRRLGSEWVKLFIMGNRAGAGHTHEDKGSFVLEFAGETFACDPGSCDYSNPLAAVVKHCQRHNMLTPSGLAERPQPQSPLLADVKPQGHGDAVAFHATIDLACGWERYFTKWQRTWDSPSPDRLTISDEYALAQGDGVEFYWQTRREVHIDGRTITLSGQRGEVVIHAPQGTTVRLDELPLADGVQKRIAIVKPAAAGKLVIEVRLRFVD